jgi:hypothetical protein
VGWELDKASFNTITLFHRRKAASQYFIQGHAPSPLNSNEPNNNLQM